jgi:hypothetical protein
MRKLVTVGLLATALVTGLSACEVNKTSDGEMPSVDAKGGEMPKVDIEAGKLPDVDVDAGKLPGVEIKGPDVEIGSKEVDVTVPTVDVDTPAQADAEAAGAPNSRFLV